MRTVRKLASLEACAEGPKRAVLQEWAAGERTAGQGRARASRCCDAVRGSACSAGIALSLQAAAVAREAAQVARTVTEGGARRSGHRQRLAAEGVSHHAGQRDEVAAPSRRCGSRPWGLRAVEEHAVPLETACRPQLRAGRARPTCCPHRRRGAGADSVRLCHPGEVCAIRLMRARPAGKAVPAALEEYAALEERSAFLDDASSRTRIPRDLLNRHQGRLRPHPRRVR